jgi:hypothetical protein
MRVEWCQALARRNRWAEEVNLLQEEMRRTLQYLDWQASQWRNEASLRTDLEPAIAAGIQAYSLKSADCCLRLRTYFAACWTEDKATVIQRIQAEDRAAPDE